MKTQNVNVECEIIKMKGNKGKPPDYETLFGDNVKMQVPKTAELIVMYFLSVSCSQLCFLIGLPVSL